MDRRAKAGGVVASLVLAGAAALWSWQGSAQNVPARQSFEIMTGSVAGTYFPMGELIARVVSHPPGLGRCEKSGVCGPAGVMVSARSSDGAVANVLAVNSGAADSGLAQGNVVADAVAGRGAFKTYGRQTHIRVMADLFPEDMQLVVASRSPVKSVADLKGRRVSLGNANSGADVIAAGILSAFGVRSAKIRRESYEASAALLRTGKIDAFFFLGGVPSPLIGDLLARGQARLVPIDGPGRARLVARVKGLSADTISPRAYRGTGPVETISCHTLWIAKDSASPDIVYGLVRALYNPANREMLAQGPSAAQDIKLGETTSLLSVPVHPGAMRFYREMGQPIAAKPQAPKRK